MQEPATPDISVVLVTPDRYETVRKTIRHLRAQTVKDRLELLLVAPSAKDLALDESATRDFVWFRVIAVGPMKRPTQAKAVAVRQARAPIVAFAEEHCYPDPDWAAALIAAHQQDCAAVGPIMRNANPNTMLSWAGLFLHYGCCLAPTKGRAAENLPWHNSSYKRQLLLDYGDELASLLVVEGALLEDLRARGHRLYLEPAAKTSHVNISRLASWVKHAFLGGRLFGATRAQRQRWSLWRRLVYIGGSPLIPLVRLWRTLRLIRQQPLQRELIPRMLPAVISGLLPHAVGEAIGYAFGLGRTEEYYARYEMTRIHHVTAADRQIMLD
jgi:hypothetical protein